MMNKKSGFMTPALCLVVLLTTLAFLGVFYADVTANNIRIKAREPAIETYIERRTALERSYGYFFNNYEYTGTIVYADLDMKITVEEISRTTDSRTIRLTAYEDVDGMQRRWNTYQAIVHQNQTPVMAILSEE